MADSLDEALRTRMGEAHQSLEAGELGRSESVCRSILADAPDYLPAMLLLGIVLAQLERPKEAGEVFRRLVARDPDCGQAWNWLANIERIGNRPDEALRCSREAIRVAPQDGEGYNNLGLCLLMAGKPREASLEFEKAIHRKPGEARFHFNLGSALVTGGQLSSGATALDHAAKLNPDDPWQAMESARALLLAGARQAAIPFLERACRLEPGLIQAQLQLARALSEENRDEEAEAILLRVLETHPDHPLANSMLGFRYREAGEFQKAIRHFEAAYGAHSTHGAAFYGLLHSRKASSEDAELVREAKIALEREEATPTDRTYFHFGLGKAAADLGDFKESMEQYHAANRLAHRNLLASKRFDQTTYAKSFERTQRIFTKEFLARQKGVGNPSERPLFIVGMMRSGTTLVEQILSSHREVAAGGELPYWRENVYKAWDESRQGVNPAVASKLEDGYLELLDRIDPKADRVTDKRPQNFMFLGFLHLMFPNARIIHCRRNPLDNCLSIYMTPYDVPPEYAHHPGNIVFVYRQYRRLMAHWRKVLPPDRFLEVDYEQLSLDPETTIRKMVDFSGLEWDESCLHPEKREGTVKTPSAWQVRQPVYRTSVDRWQRYEPWLGEFAPLLDQTKLE